jgi:hypothetical protein
LGAPTVVVASSGGDALRSLEVKGPFTIMLVDHDMPEMEGHNAHLSTCSTTYAARFPRSDWDDKTMT